MLYRCGWDSLKLNPNKDEFILIGENWLRDFLKSSLPVSLLNSGMDAGESVKNLDVILVADNSIRREVIHVYHAG